MSLTAVISGADGTLLGDRWSDPTKGDNLWSGKVWRSTATSSGESGGRAGARRSMRGEEGIENDGEHTGIMRAPFSAGA